MDPELKKFLTETLGIAPETAEAWAANAPGILLGGEGARHANAQADADDNRILIGGPIVSDLEGDIYSWVGSLVSPNRVRERLDAIQGRVEVRINSPGGDVDAGSAIYQLLKERPDMRVTVEGLAASAASIVMLAADDRVIAETGRVMIHRAWSVIAGNAEELAKYAELLGKIDKTMAGIYGRAMGIDDGEALELMSEETWYTAEEAVEAGLATGIAEGRDPEKHTAEDDMRALARRGRRARANRLLRRVAA